MSRYVGGHAGCAISRDLHLGGRGLHALPDRTVDTLCLQGLS